MPEDFLSSPGIRLDNDRYQVMADVIWQFNVVEDCARSEATRKRLYVAHDSLAKGTNVPLINQMLALRNQIALKLGYKSWADYQAEVRMAKTASNAQTYIDKLIAGIHPEFEAEVRELQKMKAADTDNPKTQINIWDWRYYTTQLNKQKFALDKEALRSFFLSNKHSMECSPSLVAYSGCVSMKSNRQINGQMICACTLHPMRTLERRSDSCIWTCSCGREKLPAAANSRL